MENKPKDAHEASLAPVSLLQEDLFQDLENINLDADRANRILTVTIGDLCANANILNVDLDSLVSPF
jgi:hypothetical protein